MFLYFYFCVTDIIPAAVLSGNRNFEGRVHPQTRANYLASPPLVVAYALAGTVCTFHLSAMTFGICSLKCICLCLSPLITGGY